jgi:hypothetical protein
MASERDAVGTETNAYGVKLQGPVWSQDASGNITGLAGFSFANGGVVVYPTGTSNDYTTMQAAATAAMDAGVNLILGPGTFNLPTTGLLFNDGPVGSSAAFKGLQVYGQGSGITKIVIGDSVTGMTWGTYGGPSFTMFNAGLHGVSIIGPGITGSAIGFQVGGTTAVSSEDFQQFEFTDVVIDNVRTCAIFDSAFNIRGTQFFFLRYKYGFEWGYNVDCVYLMGLMGLDDSAVTGVTVSGVTNGANTLTVPAACAARLQVGYAINLYRDGTTTAVFPSKSYVGSINTSTNQITIVDYKGTAVNATLAAGTATTATFMVGRAFNYGAMRLDTAAGTLYPQYGSPFVSPYWDVYSSGTYAVARGRVSADAHDIQCDVIMNEFVADIGHSSHFNIKFRQMHEERLCGGYLIGDAASTICPRGLVWEDCYPQGQNGYSLTPWVWVQSTSGSGVDCEIDIHGCHADFDAVQPYLQVAKFGTPRITWENNNLPMSSTNPNVILYDTGTYGAKYQLTGFQALYAGSSRKGDAKPTITTSGSYAWNFMGQDGFKFTTSGNLTLPNPAYFANDQGKLFVVTVTAGGAHTMAFGSQFKSASGGTLTVAGTATTGQFLIAVFLWDGTYFWCQNTPTWTS